MQILSLYVCKVSILNIISLTSLCPFYITGNATCKNKEPCIKTYDEVFVFCEGEGEGGGERGEGGGGATTQEILSATMAHFKSSKTARKT